MKEVDARGLGCPEPILLTAKALKTENQVKVLVDEVHQRMNVEKYAKDQGKKTSFTEKNGYFELIIE
ncbi:tRNA 2-thiouridine synthesizing protein A [Aequitasia blattaphilus]|uniref:Sulfurtransferase TusA family protein n=1 Tax=Aequitasia blattaphilus TaxID=2949332 RepID=A0ABT1EEK1_9FIRM|nr:sulfurtransferase TusA family protein [Aequitasia blattaphilus]MCP1102892.1 sulfurtransferase TusA family protein [Aequitasia blattaphilus]MCR8615532.1 sulfurtransferase TusA family protein [Aequitasia blattaphilus]